MVSPWLALSLALAGASLQALTPPLPGLASSHEDLTLIRNGVGGGIHLGRFYSFIHSLLECMYHTHSVSLETLDLLEL